MIISVLLLMTNNMTFYGITLMLIVAWISTTIIVAKLYIMWAPWFKKFHQNDDDSETKI